jgi:hypothetical protein
MKHLILFFLLLFGLGIANAQNEDAIENLVSAFESRGAEVSRGDTVEQPFFSLRGQILQVNGQDIQVFAYPDEEAASEEADTISIDGSGTDTMMVSWMDAPHFYQDENLIVLYVGSDEATLDLLETVLGEAFAGSGVVGDLASLIAALEAKGAEVSQGDAVEQPFFSPRGQILQVNGQEVQVFEYPDEDAAGNESAMVSGDGSSVGTSMMTWMDMPHFYRARKLIVLYVGSDEATLELLETVFGRPFAGEGAVYNLETLTAALEAEEAEVSQGDAVEQEFFSPRGQILQVNGQEVQVFEYPDSSAATDEAALVSADGSSVGTSIMMWMDAPHFYLSGNLIALYVGSDEETLELLKDVLGRPFAGR